MKKNLFNLFLCLALFVAVERLCHQATEGFQLPKIQAKFNDDPSWANSPLFEDDEDRIKGILRQPFRFLSSGGQSYAFVSDDGKYVIKFFKFHHMQDWLWLSKLILPGFFDYYRIKFMQWQLSKLVRIHQSCQIADEHLRNETGLVYLHFKNSTFFNQRLTFYDKIGVVYHIDLDNTKFVLQRMAKLATPSFSAQFKKGSPDKAKECIHELVTYVYDRCQKGIGDKDPGIKRNYAFLDHRVISIDLGSFYQDDGLKNPLFAKRQVLLETARLQRWLKKRDPELLAYYFEEIEKLQ